MRKLFVSLFLVWFSMVVIFMFGAAPIHITNGTFSADSTTTTTALDYTHILFWANAESGSDGQDENYIMASANGEYPNGQEGDDNSASTIDDTLYVTGSQSFEFPTDGDFYDFIVTSDDIADDTIGTLAGWVRWGTWDARDYLLGVWSDNDNWMYIAMDHDTSGDLMLRTELGGVGAEILDVGGGALAVNTWYWVELRWSESAPSRGLYVYDSNLDLLDSATNTDAFNITNFAEVRIGDSSTASINAHIDQVIITNRISGETGYANTASSPR